LIFSNFFPVSSTQANTDLLLSTWTNCIITCNWSDGVDRTPPILFTYNKKFDCSKKLYRETDEEFKSRKAKFVKYYIDGTQVGILFQRGDEKKKYAAEQPAFVDYFMQLYSDAIDWKLVYAFTDAGNANKKIITNQYGFKHVFVYPPKVHHLLSPNDNNQHGIREKKMEV